jgi:transcriptional regulator with XRE-family HTH domain
MLRRKAGLTLAQVARAAGTSETNVSAYERGVKRTSARTERRLRAVIEAGPASPIHTAGLSTVSATAATLRRGLRGGWSTAELLRVVRQMRSDAAHLISDTDRAAFYTAPSTTGDPRWDALLAAVVEEDHLRAGETAPAWTHGHPLRTFWFVPGNPRLHAYAFAHSPMPMQVRGIMIDPGDLEAV